jgi:N-acetylneuraminic acid mutarotase
MKKQVTRPVQAHLLRGASYLLMLLAVRAIPFALAQQNVTKQSLAKLGNALPTAVFHRTLTFAERVSYQRGIEEVYWRHRIWPNTNAGPKPSLDAVVSQAQLEKKVEDYLRNSQTLEDYWQRPITADQLQAEMERMASNTRQPDVLRELFEALANDPFVIAECLARPVLTERLIADLSAQHQTGRLESLRTAELRTLAIATVSGQVAYTLPVIASPSGGCIDDTWTPTTLTNAPAARDNHTAVWTGSEMIVWGGSPIGSTGGRYNPSTDSWTATSTTNEPSFRLDHTAVWTGSEMIIWGGNISNNTGGRYNPSTDSWTATSTINAPTARIGHTAVWTGSEMIVWGGLASGPTYLNTGGKYNPSTDSWTATSTINAPTARSGHTAVGAGSEMIVWGGGASGPTYLNTGGKYNPGTDSWTATSTINAPTARSGHTAVGTGSEMIVWGGSDGGRPRLNTGGRYNPGTDSWTATSTTNAPTRRDLHTAVWTGSEMIVWGGYGCVAEHCGYKNSGGRYNPGTDSWTATIITGAPAFRGYHTALWTGSEMIVWGGTDGVFPYIFNTGGRYCAAAGGPTPTPTASPSPTATATATATATPTATPTATATATATATPTPTPTGTPRATPTPTPGLTPRPGPTPPR